MARESSRPATMTTVSIPPTEPPATAPMPPPPRPMPPYAEASLMHAFRRCWLLASTLGILFGGLVGTLWWFSIPEQYSGEIRVRIPAPWNASAGSDAGEEEIARFQATQSALIQSTTVLEEVLRRREVEQLLVIHQEYDPLAWLGNHLSVAATSIPDILLIRVHGAGVEEVVVLAQAIANVYYSTAAHQREVSLRHVKEMRWRTEESLQQKRKRLARLENSRLVAAEREASQARFELRVARAELELQEQRRPGADRVQVSEQALAAALKDDASGQKLLREMESAEEAIKQVFRVSALKENDPILPDYYRRRDETKKKLEARREDLRPLLEQQERERAIEQHQTRLNRCRERVAFCEGLVKSLHDEVESLGGAAATEELKTLREECAAAGETLRKLAREQHVLESASLPAPTGEASELVAVQRKDPKGRLRSATLGGAGCCAFLMLVVSWRELRLRCITSGSDIAGGLGLPVLGNIPCKRAGRPLTREQLDSAGTLREAVDALRTVLLHENDKGPRLLLITSAIGGEGKTTLAALLAASLARAWRKTLLIDADLRTPAAHQLFQTQPEPGLSEVLRGEAEPTEVVQPTELSRLWMISAGHWDTHAIQALAQDGVGGIFDALKEQFDFLVIDACPILPVADALLLSKHVDAVLLAVRSGVSRLPVVQAAQQRLIALDAPLRGAILMGPDRDVSGQAASYPPAKK